MTVQHLDQWFLGGKIPQMQVAGIAQVGFDHVPGHKQRQVGKVTGDRLRFTRQIKNHKPAVRHLVLQSAGFVGHGARTVQLDHDVIHAIGRDIGGGPIPGLRARAGLRHHKRIDQMRIHLGVEPLAADILRRVHRKNARDTFFPMKVSLLLRQRVYTENGAWNNVT